MEPAAPSVRIVGRYALHGVIASGGMATVHFGRLIGPVGFSRTVAIKRLHPQFSADPEFVAMFLDEARLAARIRHPNVVPTLDVVATSGELFLVMEYVPGESLSRLVRAARARATILPPNITVAIMVGVLQGLHAAHEAKNERGAPLGIVHRDVSPQNVLVGADGQARVLDFGVAKAAGRVQTTREGQLKGKLAYMAVEQLRGETCSRQTDIYAAGVVLWEALTGERLFKADNEGAVVTRVLEGVVVPPSRATAAQLDAPTRKVVERLDAIVMRALARDASKRFETARAMALALERALAPATASQVSEWVEGIASDVLLMRAAQIAEIESSDASLPPPPSAPPIPQTEAASDASAPSAPSAAAGAHPSSEGGSGAGLSSISVAANGTDPKGLAPARARGTTAAVGIGAAVLVTLAAVALLRSRHEGADLRVAPLGASPAESSTPSASRAGAEEDKPSPSAAFAEDAASVAASAPRDAADAPPAPSSPSRATRKPGQAPARGCDPPYTHDSAGMKHYKPECL